MAGSCAVDTHASTHPPPTNVDTPPTIPPYLLSKRDATQKQ